jgi:adenosylcobinamide kinase/adenosylcobinamide-phosphate guanylyltransferase
LTLAKTASEQMRLPVSYVATAQALDAEMHAKIALHRAERPSNWQTLEAPLDLGATLQSLQPDRIVIVDCMTLWLSNAMLVDFDESLPHTPLARLNSEKAALLRYLEGGCAAGLILVSNEVGGGIVPISPLARRFQDEQGRLNQALAAVCDRVTLVVAGIGLGIKPQ